MSEDIIVELQDVPDLDLISTYQKLCEKSIADNSERVFWAKIFEYQELSEEFFSKYSHKTDWRNPKVCK